MLFLIFWLKVSWSGKENRINKQSLDNKASNSGLFSLSGCFSDWCLQISLASGLHSCGFARWKRKTVAMMLEGQHSGRFLLRLSVLQPVIIAIFFLLSLSLFSILCVYCWLRRRPSIISFPSFFFFFAVYSANKLVEGPDSRPQPIGGAGNFV